MTGNCCGCFQVTEDAALFRRNLFEIGPKPGKDSDLPRHGRLVVTLRLRVVELFR